MRSSEVVRRLREGVAAAGRFSNPAQESVELHHHVADLIDDLTDLEESQLDRDDVDAFLGKLRRFGLGWTDTPFSGDRIEIQRRSDGEYVLLEEVAYFVRNPESSRIEE